LTENILRHTMRQTFDAAGVSSMLVCLDFGGGRRPASGLPTKRTCAPMNAELKHSSAVFGRRLVEGNPAQPMEENRVLLGALFVAVTLLGPAFTLGYFSGYRLGRAGDLRGVARAAAPAEIVPRQTPLAVTRQQPPERPIPTPPAGQPATAQIYLQLAASAKGHAAVAIGALQSNGFLAVVREVPDRPELYRVLIGPLRENELEKTRADLESKGFAGGTAIKRTF